MTMLVPETLDDDVDYGADDLEDLDERLARRTCHQTSGLGPLLRSARHHLHQLRPRTRRLQGRDDVPVSGVLRQHGYRRHGSQHAGDGGHRAPCESCTRVTRISPAPHAAVDAAAPSNRSPTSSSTDSSRGWVVPTSSSSSPVPIRRRSSSPCSACRSTRRTT